MLHYICLSMSSSLRSLSASPLSPCQRAITAASRKTQTISFLLAHLPQPLLRVGIFPPLSTCKSPKTEIFYLSSPLEMKSRQYGWIGGYGVYIFACFSSSTLFLFVSPHWPPSFSLTLFVKCVCVHSSRSGCFTIFCRLQSQLIICGWILCPGATRELKPIQELLSNTCRGWKREA